MTHARFELDEYTTRVLDVIKGKFGLKNRNDALIRFAHQFGEKYVEPTIDESVLIELDKTYADHVKKHAKRKMNENELNELLNIR